MCDQERLDDAVNRIKSIIDTQKSKVYLFRYADSYGNYKSNENLLIFISRMSILICIYKFRSFSLYFSLYIFNKEILSNPSNLLVNIYD